MHTITTIRVIHERVKEGNPHHHKTRLYILLCYIPVDVSGATYS